jgi:hypothetical protein
MAWQSGCLICHADVPRRRCPVCGADPEKVERIMQSETLQPVPSVWQSLKGQPLPGMALSESLWEEVSGPFQERISQEYQQLYVRASVLSTAVLLPTVVLLLGTCFWTGVHVARALGVGGKERVWLCGAAAILVLLPFRVFSIGGYVESWLLRSNAEMARQALLERVVLIGPAIQRRCRLPWYVNPDRLMLAAVTIVLLVGWLLF